MFLHNCTGKDVRREDAPEAGRTPLTLPHPS
jgi:hypothetical protein